MIEISNFVGWEWSESNGLTINTFGKGEFKTHSLTGIHRPYFYVENPNPGLDVDYEVTTVKPHDGTRPLYRVVVDRPAQVKDVREKFKSTYEADILYHRRLFIDDVLRYTFDVITYYDIEVSSNNKLLCIGSQSVVTKTSVSERTVSKAVQGCSWIASESVEDEDKILTAFCNRIRETSTDVLVGWNNSQYDKVVLMEKMTDEQKKFFGAIPQIDLMWEYRKRRHPPRMGLDFVAKREGFGGKIEGIDKTHMEKLDAETLKRYNMRDVELLVQIDTKYGLTDLVCELSALTGVGVEEQSAMRMVDSMILKKGKQTERALPTTPRRREDEEVEGATVLDAPQEVCQEVSVFDFESLYPNVILNEKIGSLILREVLAEGLERRRQWAKDYIDTRKTASKVRSDAYKVVNNSMYGVMGNPYFRLYNVEDQAKVTGCGRGMLRLITEAVAGYGFEVIYGDTDSIFVRCGDIDDARVLEVKLNRMMKPYSLKFEKYYKRLIFPGGAKKRYAGHLVWEKGKVVDEIDVTGLEAIRMDWCELAKEAQMMVIEDVLKNGLNREQVQAKLTAMHKELYNHQFDSKLIITKSIDTGKEYTTSLPHVRAYAILRSKGKNIEGGRIEYVYVRKGVSTSDVYPLVGDWKSMLDYDWYWNHQVKAVVSRILDVAFPTRMSLTDFYGGE